MSTPMKSFAQFIAEGSQTGAGSSTRFEEYIAVAWNAILTHRSRYITPQGLVKPGVTFPQESGLNEHDHNTYAEPAFMIALELLNDTKSTKALICTGSEKPPITDIYRQWGGKDRTPKTDVYTADKKYRWSMKSSTGSVLMSGGHSDVFPTFKIAESEWRKSSEADVVSRLGKALSTVLTNIQPPPGVNKYIDVKHKTTIPGKGLPGFGDAAMNPELRKGFPPEVNRFLNELTLQDIAIKGKLNDELQSMFNMAANFRNHFVFEAASGAGKFGDQSPTSVANEFMKFSTDGLVLREPFYEGASSASIKKLSSQISFRLRWKHGTKIRLAAEIFESTTARPATYQELLERHLRQHPLDEGLMDWGKAQWSSFTAWVKTFVQVVLAEVKRLVAKGLDAVYQFFDMELAGVELTSVPVITL